MLALKFMVEFRRDDLHPEKHLRVSNVETVAQALEIVNKLARSGIVRCDEAVISALIEGEDSRLVGWAEISVEDFRIPF